jgi:NADH-quinone oxidoreductase subunit G
VLRVLGTMLGLPNFGFDTIDEVRAAALPADITARLSNGCTASVDVSPAANPVTASIYQLDGLVRRAPSLQATADAQGGC